MKKCIVLICLLLTVATVLDAQSRRRQSNKVEFADKVWFGVNLNDLRFGNRTFQFGVTPMAAVEVADNFSLGLMLKADYYYERIEFFGGDRIKFESLDFGPAVFARVDVMDQFFGQIEYERAFLERPLLDAGGGYVVIDDKIVTDRVDQNYVYFGIGYQSGQGNLKGTISLHYNILDDFDSIRIPWDYRVGIRWYLR